MESLSDKELISGIQSANSDCFEAFFYKFYPGLCRYAHFLLKSNTDAEEIVQELFVKFWEKKNEIVIDSSIKSYLYKSLHNSCLNFLEHKKVHARYSSNYLLENKDLISPVSMEYPIANLLVKELDSIITDAINNLPEQCREVFIKVRHEELSYSEAAESLGISVNTVKTQLQRAMAKLREALQEYFPC